MGLTEILAGIKIAREAGPAVVSLIRSAVDGREPSAEEIASAEAAFDRIKARRDALIENAERRSDSD